METKDTAVALLKEWKKAKQDIDIHRASKVVYCKTVEEMQWKGILPMEKCEAILEDVSRRLDEKAEAAGITNNGGFFGARNVSRGLGDFKGTFTILAPVCLDLYLPIETKELHAILEWLLIKNEEKTA